MYSHMGAYISHLCHNHKARIAFRSAEQLPDDGLGIKHDSILLQLGHEPHCDSFLPTSITESIHTEADHKTVCQSRAISS